jgi:hypothetical protein
MKNFCEGRGAKSGCWGAYHVELPHKFFISISLLRRLNEQARPGAKVGAQKNCRVRDGLSAQGARPASAERNCHMPADLERGAQIWRRLAALIGAD